MIRKLTLLNRSGFAHIAECQLVDSTETVKNEMFSPHALGADSRLFTILHLHTTPSISSRALLKRAPAEDHATVLSLRRAPLHAESALILV
jgi:hypothetical protein